MLGMMVFTRQGSDQAALLAKPNPPPHPTVAWLLQTPQLDTSITANTDIIRPEFFYKLIYGKKIQI